MRQEPAGEEDGLAREDVVDGDESEDDAVVEKEDDRAEAVGQAESDGFDRDADIVHHELAGKGRVLAGPAIFGGLFLHSHALRGVAEMVGKHRGHHGFLGFVVEHHGEAAKEHADERDDP